MTRHTHASPRSWKTFQHEALFYENESDFVAGTLTFIREGLVAGMPVVVAVRALQIDQLRSALGQEASGVRWIDMAGIGRNPARIIPLWRELLRRHSWKGTLYGIGEPVWAERGPDEMSEALHHEELLNLAFADARGFQLLCPYHQAGLEAGVLERARHSHPHVRRGAARRESEDYIDPGRGAGYLAEALPDAPPGAAELQPVGASVPAVRGLLRRPAEAAGLPDERTEDLVLAVLAARAAVAHAGVEPILRVWQNRAGLVCEVAGGGQIHDPLTGREWPPSTRTERRGTWIANQLCDLVQLRSSGGGTILRLHMAA